METGPKLRPAQPMHGHSLRPGHRLVGVRYNQWLNMTTIGRLQMAIKPTLFYPTNPGKQNDNIASCRSFSTGTALALRGSNDCIFHAMAINGCN